MRIHQTFIVLASALSFCASCRSASVASRHDNSVVPRPQVFAQSGERSETSEPTLIQISESNRSSATAEQTSDEVAESSVKTAAVDAATVQQVSAETNGALATMADEPIVWTLSVQAAIEAGLSQNPDLIALRQTEGVGTAVVGVAKTYPFNPFLQVQATPYQRNLEGNTGSTYHYVLLMQQIQLGHQQQFREEAANASLNSIRWNLLQAELLNVAQTERLYFAAVYQQGIRDLARINSENNQQLLRILQRQQEIGQATSADVAIVRLDARSTAQQLRIAEANVQTALLDLKRQLCLPAECKIALDPHVINWDWRPANATELASFATNRPDVMAARSDTETARANTNLANGSRIPDLQIGPYYQRDDFGTYYLGFRGQMDVPVVNNGMPLLRQRQAELCQRSTIAQQLAARANLEAQAAADRYERARQLHGDAEGSSHPSVPVELQRLEEQFKANEVDILRVMQARNSLLQSQRADLDSLNEVMQAAVAVTAASGVPLETLASPGLPEPEAAKPVTE